MESNVLQQLIDTPQCGIIAIYNPDTRKVFLTFTKNMSQYLGKLAYELNMGTFKNKELVRDKDNLKVIVLETLPSRDYEVLRLHMYYWQRYIKKLGLTEYKQNIYVRYRTRINYGLDYDGQQVVYVELVNGSKTSVIVVGVFEKLYEAEEFIEQVYKPQKYIYPVYACNNRTRHYYLKESEKLENMFNIRI